MASENVESWDLPLPTREDIDEPRGDKMQYKNSYELPNNIESIAYKHDDQVNGSYHTESLSKRKKRIELLEPIERSECLKRCTDKHNTITIEQLEKVMRCAKKKERQKEDVLKRKEEIYYQLLTKVNLQCRYQYLNYVLKKFAEFIAKLSTIQEHAVLSDSYARMQTDVFCNILRIIGVEPTIQAYNKIGSEYAVCHKLSHALSNIIIKTLDLSVACDINDEVLELESNLKTDNDIRDRLIRATNRKLYKKL